jgi:rare lipoprotein A
MKKITHFFTVFLILAVSNTLQAYDDVSSPDNSAYRQDGIASWYGAEFEGHPTASGEPFNPSQLTAAHPNLPFGTMLKITNKQNNKQVVVRVNDRGPFVSARIVDVSRAAAEALDILGTGTAPVLVESIPGPIITVPPVPQVLPPLPPPQIIHQDPPAVTETVTVITPTLPPQAEPAQPPAFITTESAAVIKPKLPATGTNKRYRLQVGAYRITRNAVEAFDRIKNLGLDPAYERHEDLYRVVLADIKVDDIQSLAEKLGSVGFREILIREEPNSP